MGGKLSRFRSRNKEQSKTQTNAPARPNQYEEIDDADIIVNQQKLKKARAETDDDDVTSDEPVYQNTEAPTSSTQKSPDRRHPYDEISAEELTSNRAAISSSQTNGFKLPRSYASTAEESTHESKSKSKDDSKPSKPRRKTPPQDDVKLPKSNTNDVKIPQNDVTSSNSSDDENVPYIDDVEYQNVQTVANDVTGLDRGESEDGDYKVPPKSKEMNPPQSLNYIEVEFNPLTAKPEMNRSTSEQSAKRDFSPTTYTDVIHENGKIVLVTNS